MTDESYATPLELRSVSGLNLDWEKYAAGPGFFLLDDADPPLRSRTAYLMSGPFGCFSASMQLRICCMGGRGLDQAKVAKRIRELGPWFHNMVVGGVRTQPDHFLGDYPEVKFRHWREKIPADLTGYSVLDIGCNAGFFSQALKRRGAERVVGIDTDERYLSQARFAAEVEGLAIEFIQMSVWEIASLRERFDLVLFMGVLYHLRHPLLALDLIHEHVASDLLVFQSLQRGSRELYQVERDYDFEVQQHFEDEAYPKLHFVEHSYSNDPTNWWIPNRSCVEAMLRSSGFRIESQPEDETYVCRWQPITAPADGPHVVYPRER